MASVSWADEVSIEAQRRTLRQQAQMRTAPAGAVRVSPNSAEPGSLDLCALASEREEAHASQPQGQQGQYARLGYGGGAGLAGSRSTQIHRLHWPPGPAVVNFRACAA